MNTSTLVRPTQLTDLSMLQPRLHNYQWTQRKRLSDDGFCESTASINLSRGLAMGLDANGATLSFRALAEVGLSTRKAWDLAADNLVAAAQRSAGTCFYLRDGQLATSIKIPSLQIRVPCAPISAWLAHPRTFSIVHKHVSQRLGSSLVYFSPNSDMLIAIVKDHAKQRSMEKWAESTQSQLLQPGEEHISASPLTYALGFPTILESRHKQH